MALPSDKNRAFSKILSASVLGFNARSFERKLIRSEDDEKASLIPSLTKTITSPEDKFVLQVVGFISSKMPSGREFPSMIFTLLLVIIKEKGEPILIKSTSPEKRSITPISRAVKLSSLPKVKILITVDKTVSDFIPAL